MNQAIVLRENQPMAITEIKAQVGLVQEVMKSIMNKGHHYGIIPGCGNKPTLLKPGAEILLITFRLQPDYEILSSVETDNFIMYNIKCTLKHINTGKTWATGIGACNTKEKKYLHGTPWDLQNNILKMGEKRALVAATLNATAASDIFTQDMEDAKPDTSKSQNTTSNNPVCPKCNSSKSSIPDKYRKDSKNGYLCYVKKDGCGNKWVVEEEQKETSEELSEAAQKCDEVFNEKVTTETKSLQDDIAY